MDNPKKILIFYASAGHGHEKAARAILEAVQSRYPDADSRVVDVVGLMPSFAGVFYRQSYLLQIKHTPWLWGFFYYLLDIPWAYFIARGLRRAFNTLSSRKLIEMLVREQPDAIFTTHFYASEVVSHLKARKIIHPKLITVVTDYFAHLIWTAPHTDFYAVGLAETKEGLMQRGAPAERIEITGIPVEKKFFKPVLPESIRSSLRLTEGVFTALITSGGVGIGALEPLLKKLLFMEKHVQVILVCGSNKALYEKMNLPENAHIRLRVLAFVNNMNELMEVSDVVIGKAGGLTITESFLKHKPVIMTGSIPGQEARNVICVKAHNAGIEARTIEDVAAAVALLLDSADEIKQLKVGAAEIARPDAAEHIASLAVK